VTSPVLAALRNAVAPKHTMFENWCSLKGFRPLPATPALIASFVSDCEALGIDKIWPDVCEISQAHVAEGLADPTAGGVVASAINGIAKIDPPRSWPGEKKISFYSLPYDLQSYLDPREKERDKTIRQLQNEAARLRRTFADLQEYFCLGFLPSTIEENYGNTPHPAA
jgi:hypothetical protein